MSQELAPQDTCVLVTGGAGFIGSHTVVELLAKDYQVVIVDDLSNSSPIAVDRIKQIAGDEAAKRLTFYEANVLDRDAMNRIFDAHRIDRVIHFAGFKAVGESVPSPWSTTTTTSNYSLVLPTSCASMAAKSIISPPPLRCTPRPRRLPVRETAAPRSSATNPYGWTKCMIEQISWVWHMPIPIGAFALLRYFNPIGAHKSGLIGEDPKGIPNNLVPYVAQVAVGKLEAA